jgi:hypothetical protein
MNLNDIDDLNYNFYMGALHLFEAGKYFSNFDKEYANTLFIQAKGIIGSIEVQKEKMEKNEMSSILDKIMAFDLNQHEKLKEIETGLNLANE